MIIVGSVNSNKEELLINEYSKLIASGEDPNSILFLALNAYKKEKIQTALKSITSTPQNVFTFLGLCYNSILDNWQELQKSITFGEPKDTPMLCGLEVSQSLLLDAVKQVGFKDYNSKINLVHQLLRRHTLIVQNNLSEKEIEQKSKLLDEGFHLEAQKALEIFKAKTLELRAFDYIRQQSLFKYIYQNTTVLSHIKHIFIDDYDEQTPACTDFFKHLKPQLKSYTIAIDPKGSTRYGYLCADINCTDILKEEKNIIQASIEKNDIKISKINYSKRLEMLQACVNNIEQLLEKGTDPSEISIITPLFDNQLKFLLQNEFESKSIPCQFISGSEKLIENNLVKSSIALLRLINNLEAGIDEIGTIFISLLKFPQKYSCKIMQQYSHSNGFLKQDFADKKLNEKYDKFLSLAQKISPKAHLGDQLQLIYEELIKTEDFSEEEIDNFLFFEKQMKDLDTVTLHNQKDRILNQLEHSIIAENDTDSFKRDKNALVVGTPQKIADFDIKAKYQFWLDITNEEWIKQDTGTIYNAWVFAKSWGDKPYTYEDSIKCIQNKTHRLLRKLYLLTTEHIYAYSSTYNPLGQENLGAIDAYIKDKKEEKEQTQTPAQTFIPRADQKEVLEYNSGNLAISAVPGAGKTTVLCALISKMLNSGIPGDNIFVLTYMESAAKTIKERISLAAPNSDKLPNVSTIHGLALRIIKENGNYSYVNLGEDFDICDDLQRQKLIRTVISEQKLNYDDFEKYEKGISIAKFTKIISQPKSKEMKAFITFYNSYQTKLRDNNLIDYDDMLFLAVKILEENPQILKYYQNICRYIIEDEAQDSSAIQQKLIKLLAGNNNIVRCGDLNQAITSTFTNADTQGFKDFIKTNKSIEMNHSQRCAKGIYELANSLIIASKQIEETKNAFFDIKMHGVEGKNPKSSTPVFAKIFETEDEEKNAIINRIKAIFKASPNASIAILLRNNFQVNLYSALLKEYGITTVSRTDCLEQNTIFNKILSILKFCTTPWDNIVLQDVYKTLFNIKEDNLYLQNLECPFISIDPASLEDENLITLHWEIMYWLNQSQKPFEYLALKIGEYYSQNEIDRSNLYIISEVIKRISAQSQSRSELIFKLQQIAKRPTITGLKLFSENDTTISNFLGGKVQIMTMHKAKGDEFDYVFLPELTESALPTELATVKTNANNSFYEAIKALAPQYKTKTTTQSKTEILEENLRLLYVAITRAKLQIYFTTAQKYKKFGRLKDCPPNNLFKNLLPTYLSTKL